MNETPTQPVRAGYFELTFEDEPDLGLEELRGIGPKTAQKLVDREITDQAELLLFVPRKYRRIARHLPGPEVARRRSSYVELVGKVLRKKEPARHSRAPFEVHWANDRGSLNHKEHKGHEDHEGTPILSFFPWCSSRPLCSSCTREPPS